MPILARAGAAAARGFGMLGKIAAAVDEFFEYVTLMLPGNGTNGAQNNTFLDSSTNNFTITRNGNTTQGTFAPYGSLWSNYFDGNGDQLSAQVGAISSVGSSNFSIECFVYFLRNTNTFAQGLVSYGVAGSTTGTSFLSFQTDPSGYPAVAYATGSSLTLTSSVLPPTNQWTHLVVCRSGSTLSIFVNGVRTATTTTSATVGASGDALTIGGQWFANNSGRQLQGYISNARIVRGSSAYDATQSNITVPTAPLTAITNTSLLTCQSNRFIDNSTNAYAITVAGDTSVQVFSPFSPTAPYAAGTIGGSGYFDGSGDYLTTAYGSGLRLINNDFTIEGWFYLTAAQADMGIVSSYENNNGWLVRLDTTFIRLVAADGSVILVDRTYSFSTNVWYHFAWTRSGSSIRCFVNGTQVGATATISGTATDSTTQGAQIGRTQTISNDFKGYISNLRLVNGTAVYTSNFTPPTAPLTAITNTSLLLNFTNGGIIDNAMMNDLETVGNAQISTTQSKFGGASISLDGTGDWLIGPASPNLVANGDFTVEAWVYMNANSGSHTIVNYSNASGQTQWALLVGSFVSGKASFYWVNTSPTGFNATGTTTIPTGQWVHLAGTREGTTLRIFVNGVLEGTTTASGSVRSQSSPLLVVGQSGIGTETFNGYIDDLRVTKGYARYTTSFTAPTAPFPLQ